MPSSHIPILPKDIEAAEKMVNSLLAAVSWKPKKSLMVSTVKEDAGQKRFTPPPVSLQTVEDKLSLLKIIQIVGGDAALLPESLNKLLWAVRTGMCLGFHLAVQYGAASGLRELEALNAAGRLGTSQKEEFSSKYITASAVALFTAASYVVWELSLYEPEKVSKVQAQFQGVPEFPLQNPQSSMTCMLYYLAVYLDSQKSGLVKTPYEAIAMTIRYFEGVIQEIKTRQESFKYPEFFTNVSYQLADTAFTVEGFEPLRSNGIITSVEFNKVSFDEIVGNREAKHQARRLAQRLVCYDLTRKKNPFLELGGLPRIRLGHGKPGTGKSMILAALATMIEELCGMLGLRFIYLPLPDNMVSTYQGGSSDRMAMYMKQTAIDDAIICMHMDDAENVLEDRTRNGVSEGVRGLINVFLRYTEGVYAINRGNVVIDICTNLPEQIDAAVMSRIQTRYAINGAETEHDFLDQNYLWCKKLEKMNKGFVAMIPPSDYEYLSDQVELQSLNEIKGDIVNFADDRILTVHKELVAKGIDHKHHSYFAKLLCAVHKIFPIFTSRDLRNIQVAVDNRIMDFDLPDEWYENLELFFEQEYETKVSMLKELMKANMKGLSFAEILLQEVIKYLNGVSQIANLDRERQIAKYIESREISRESESRMANSK